MPEILTECKNHDECGNYADMSTGGDMNPYGPVEYSCDECIDEAVAAYYG